MSQKAAIRRRRQAVQGDNHVAPGQRKFAKPSPMYGQRVSNKPTKAKK